MAKRQSTAEIDAELNAEAKRSGHPLVSAGFARHMDVSDPLKSFRGRFAMPKAAPHKPDSKEAIYFCGNSLGAMPKRARDYLNEELDKWENMAVEGHFLGRRPWARIDERAVELSAQLVHSDPSEIAVMNTLSANLHFMLVSFYRPTKSRHKILMEDYAFCSDAHVVKSQIAYHGLDISSSLLTIKPREGEVWLRTEDILAIIEREGDSIAVVLLGGVQFYTGQAFDMKTITAAAQAKGCYVGWDCAHAAGNFPLYLHDWNVDFACWCTYKYLNSGAGSIGVVFVHSKHHNKSFKELPRFLGWWGQDPDQRFKMLLDHSWKPGAQSYQLSNPPILPTVCLEASLELHLEATVPAMRAKSMKLTRYLEYLLDTQISSGVFDIITPRDPNQRGCQLSLLFSFPVRPLVEKLANRGIIVDMREPNVIRVSPTPLYNTFSEVFNFVNILKAELASLPRSKL